MNVEIAFSRQILKLVMTEIRMMETAVLELAKLKKDSAALRKLKRKAPAQMCVEMESWFKAKIVMTEELQQEMGAQPPAQSKKAMSAPRFFFSRALALRNVEMGR